jgi:hypothetical protein
MSPWRLLATTALIILSGSMSQAQEIARAFDQLPAVAKAGDAVTVTDAGGGQTIGRVLQFTPTTLGILTISGRRDLSEADVMTIVRRGHGDPGTGARWGLGVGAAIGLLFTAGSFGSGCYDCLWEVALGGAMFAGIGAGVGAGISARFPPARCTRRSRIDDRDSCADDRSEKGCAWRCASRAYFRSAWRLRSDPEPRRQVAVGGPRAGHGRQPENGAASLLPPIALGPGMGSRGGSRGVVFHERHGLRPIARRSAHRPPPDIHAGA